MAGKDKCVSSVQFKGFQLEMAPNPINLSFVLFMGNQRVFKFPTPANLHCFEREGETAPIISFIECYWVRIDQEIGVRK